MDKEKRPEHSKRFFVVLLIISTTLGGVGQFLFKAAFSGAGIIAAVFIAGLIAYGISTLMYFYALGRMHLSWAYSFGGISYIVASVLAGLSLGEAISPVRWVGILLIAVGTAVIGLS